MAIALRAQCQVLVTHDGPLGEAAAEHMRSLRLEEIQQFTNTLIE